MEEHLISDLTDSEKFIKMALLFACVIFFVYLCSRKGYETIILIIWKQQ